MTVRPSQPGPLGVFLRDLHRRTEPPNTVIKIIIVYKAATAALLFFAAVLLLGLIVDREWSERLREIIAYSQLRADNRFLQDLLRHAGLPSRRTTTTLGLISLFYALLETTEVIGLADRRRWAEYLVLLATVLFLPYEAMELFRHATIVKLLILVANIGIAAYLVRQKQLFQDSAEEAEQQVRVPDPALLGDRVEGRS